MKINMPVTNVEHELEDGQPLVSKTDLKGITTYANRAFIEISGYSEEELVGKSHNIVRHPDMPPAAFADLWDTVKSGKAWSGIVKNRCKNGDFYMGERHRDPGQGRRGYRRIHVGAPQADPGADSGSGKAISTDERRKRNHIQQIQLFRENQHV